MPKDKNSSVISVTEVDSTNEKANVGSQQINLEAITSQVVSLSEIDGPLTTEQKLIVLKRLNYDSLESLDDLPIGASFMLAKIESISEQDSIQILEEALVDFDGDVNFPNDAYDLIGELVKLAPEHLNNQSSQKLSKQFSEEKLDTSSAEHEYLEHKLDYFKVFDWSLQTRIEAAMIAFHSPYPEVRSVADCYDDQTIPAETFRVYLLGIIWTALGAFINQFFSERQPSVSLGSSVVQLFLYPCGHALAYILPKKKLKIFRFTIDLNPGPWTYKEQLLATLFYVASGTPYVASNILVQKLDIYYDNKWVDWGYQILLCLSNNFLGFGLAGVMRRFCVYPVKSLWPSILPMLALNKALMQPEKRENINGWKISRFNFFFVVFAASFIYFWFPDYIFQALSSFNWLAWIKPDNQRLADITGFQTGLGLNPIPSFDWNIIGGGALTNPFYTTINSYAGTVIAFFTICGIYYTNSYWTGYIPINTNLLFSNTGEPYRARTVLNEKSLFDAEKYKKYGPPFYSAANMVAYGSYFALYPFSIVYEMFVNWKGVVMVAKHLVPSFKRTRRSTYDGFDDPHSRMMSHYKEVPEWCFLVVLVISIVLAIICVKVYPAETPVWTIFFVVAINFVFLFPLTAIYAATGFSFGLNVLVELIIGYALPGNPLALNFVKAFGVNIDAQADNYLSSHKMAHYNKIPPRAFFRVQFLSTLINSFVCLAVLNWQINSFEDYCMPHNKDRFTCPGTNTFYSASVIWGVIGPKRVFNGLYPILKYTFLIGFLLALFCIAIRYYLPNRYVKFFQPTIVIGGATIFAPYNLSYYTGGVYLSFAFMRYIKRRYLTWWEKYNYLFSSGMSAGIAFSSIIIFFAVQYHPKFISWWGNNVNSNGYDYYGLPRLNATELAPEGYFGPRIGHFP